MYRTLFATVFNLIFCILNKWIVTPKSLTSIKNKQFIQVLSEPVCWFYPIWFQTVFFWAPAWKWSLVIAGMFSFILNWIQLDWLFFHCTYVATKDNQISSKRSNLYGIKTRSSDSISKKEFLSKFWGKRRASKFIFFSSFKFFFQNENFAFKLFYKIF